KNGVCFVIVRFDKIDYLSLVKYLILTILNIKKIGTGESGKSTIAKQLRIVNKEKFTKEERKQYISLVHSNVIGSIKAVIRAHGEFSEPSLRVCFTIFKLIFI